MSLNIQILPNENKNPKLDAVITMTPHDNCILNAMCNILKNKTPLKTTIRQDKSKIEIDNLLSSDNYKQYIDIELFLERFEHTYYYDLSMQCSHDEYEDEINKFTNSNLEELADIEFNIGDTYFISFLENLEFWGASVDTSIEMVRANIVDFVNISNVQVPIFEYVPFGYTFKKRVPGNEVKVEEKL